MNKINGLVVAKKTNDGIADLLVVAYDAGSQTQEPRKGRKSPRAISVAHFGKRISSTLTDSDGKFEIGRDDLRMDDPGARIDLVLAVFAPEDVQDMRRPVPLSPEKRLLYVSSVARKDAGAEESYLIRLSDEQVETFGLGPLETSSIKKQQTGASSVVTSIKNTYSNQEAISSSLKDIQEKKFTKAMDVKKQAKKRVGKLNAIPPHLKKSEYLLTDDKDLNDLQNKAVTQGLKKLKNYKASLSINLSKAEIKKLHLKKSNDIYKGKIPHDDLMQIISSRTGGTDLVLKQKTAPKIYSTAEIMSKYNIADVPKKTSEGKLKTQATEDSNKKKTVPDPNKK